MPSSKLAAPLTTLAAQDSSSSTSALQKHLQAGATSSQLSQVNNKDSLSVPLSGSNSIDPTRPNSSKLRGTVQKMKMNPQM